MKHYLILLLLPFAIACRKDDDKPLPLPADIKLKQMLFEGLPSPHYDFTYNAAGLMTAAGYASGERMYTLSYDNGKLVAMNSSHPSNKDRLLYTYENNKVVFIKFVNEQGVVFKRCYLDYNPNGQLITMEWELKVDAGYALLRTVTFSYYPDGNLMEKKDKSHVIPGQQNGLVKIDRFENYDAKKNSDDFSLLHPYNDHMILLPGIVLQKNNARKQIRTGTGINYFTDFTFIYNSSNLVARKTGDSEFTSGTDTGDRFTFHIDYSYYD